MSANKSSHASASAERATADPPPAVFLFLNLPFGITSGYVLVILPFVVVKSGLSVGLAASLVAFGLLPKALKLFWAPLADLELTLKAWYRIGTAFTAIALLLQVSIPVHEDTAWLLGLGAFAMEVGSSFCNIVSGAMMASLANHLKGKAAAAHQLGGKVGKGIGGGSGVWLVAHATPFVAGAVLGAVCLLCSIGLTVLEEPPRSAPRRELWSEVAALGKHLWALASSRQGLLAIGLCLSPIGISGASNLWSAVAPEWHLSADDIALVVGVASVVASGVGCLLAGVLADRADRWRLMLGVGALAATIPALLAVVPRFPAMFATGTLTQALLIGMGDVALTAVVLQVIGRDAAATKYTLLFGLANVPDLYTTKMSGWIHDRWGTTPMLGAEAIFTFLCIGLAAYALRRAFAPTRAVPAMSLS
jgi:MFS transporter, PAT family, beta-lactamase induction signal transducer AmpG